MSVYLAQQLIQQGQLKLVEKELPETIAPDQLLLRVQQTGICGSDREYYCHGRCGYFVPRGPLVLGHEFSGTVAAAGAACTLKEGTAVMVDPSIPCRNCHYCWSGRYHLCTSMKLHGSACFYPHLDGGFAEYVLAPEANCIPFDVSLLSWEHAALAEPLMVAIFAVSKIQNPVFKEIAVFGGGTMGQLLLTTLQAFGAGHCTLIEPREKLRHLAEDRGAQAVYHPSELDKQEFDVCIEAAGNGQALNACYEHCRRGGQIIQVGILNEAVSLPANMVMAKELTVQGSLRYAHVFKLAADFLIQKKVNVTHMVSHTVSLRDLEKGFALLMDPSSDALKVQVAVGSS